MQFDLRKFIVSGTKPYIINGTKASDGLVYLDPQGSAARQQGATILMNFCQNVKK